MDRGRVYSLVFHVVVLPILSLLFVEVALAMVHAPSHTCMLSVDESAHAIIKPNTTETKSGVRNVGEILST